MKYESPATKVVTGIVTLVNAYIWEPITIKNHPPIYMATLMIPKSEKKTIAGINLAIQTTVKMGVSRRKGRFGQAAMQNLPLLDGDDEALNPVFRGHYILHTANTVAPTVVDHSVYPIKETEKVTSGSKVRITVEFFSYPAGREYKTGVGCRLGNIQKALLVDNHNPLPDIDIDKFAEYYLRIFNEKAYPNGVRE